jgi:tryptophan halogenase
VPPLHLRDPLTRRFVRATAPTFYELDGVDCLLLGQGYPCELVTTTEPLDAWRARKEAADVSHPPRTTPSARRWRRFHPIRN